MSEVLVSIASAEPDSIGDIGSESSTEGQSFFRIFKKYLIKTTTENKQFISEGKLCADIDALGIITGIYAISSKGQPKIFGMPGIV